MSKYTSEDGSTSVGPIAFARAIVEAVERVAAVADVHSRGSTAVATYGPGETIRGVAVRQEAGVITAEIQVRLRYIAALQLLMVSDEIRQAAKSAIAELASEPVGRIDVLITDLLVDEGGRVGGV